MLLQGFKSITITTSTVVTYNALTNAITICVAYASRKYKFINYHSDALNLLWKI